MVWPAAIDVPIAPIVIVTTGVDRPPLVVTPVVYFPEMLAAVGKPREPPAVVLDKLAAVCTLPVLQFVPSAVNDGLA